MLSGLVPEPAGQVAEAGEDGGGQAGPTRLPAGWPQARPRPGALADWAASLHPEPRPARLPGSPPDSVRLLPPHQRDLPPRPPRPGHHELLLPHLPAIRQHRLFPGGRSCLPGSFRRENIARYHSSSPSSSSCSHLHSYRL